MRDRWFDSLTGKAPAEKLPGKKVQVFLGQRIMKRVSVTQKNVIATRGFESPQIQHGKLFKFFVLHAKKGFVVARIELAPNG